MTTTTLPTQSPVRTVVEQQLNTAQDLFIRRWGEMGQTWGINRTMAEIHALLYITAQPLCTDDVMERLNISRGNASMSLRALCDWGIVRRLHKRGERRESPPPHPNHTQTTPPLHPPPPQPTHHTP